MSIWTHRLRYRRCEVRYLYCSVRQAKLRSMSPVCGKIFPVLVTHMVTARDVPDYAQERGVALYLSYQFAAAIGAG